MKNIYLIFPLIKIKNYDLPGSSGMGTVITGMGAALPLQACIRVQMTFGS